MAFVPVAAVGITFVARGRFGGVERVAASAGAYRVGVRDLEARALDRLDRKGKGVLLLHDIQPRTALALPVLLKALKARGYRIVHVVPATPERPATPTEPQEWQLHPPSETVAISHWPKIPNFVFTNAGMLPAPSLSDLDWRDGQSMTLAESDRGRRASRGVPLPREAPWPRQSPKPLDNAAITLPVPAQSIFEIQEKRRAARQGLAPSSHQAEQALPEATDGRRG